MRRWNRAKLPKMILRSLQNHSSASVSTGQTAFTALSLKITMELGAFGYTQLIPVPRSAVALCSFQAQVERYYSARLASSSRMLRRHNRILPNKTVQLTAFRAGCCSVIRSHLALSHAGSLRSHRAFAASACIRAPFPEGCS